ncbi:hypothetical protein KQI84_02720 [bacterium]|nr:hypothetical protein [bacterium]
MGRASLALAFAFCMSCGSIAVAVELNASLSPDMDSHYNKTCLNSECHPVEISHNVLQHSPYLEGACLSCHVDHSSSAPQLLDDRGNGMCLDCHTDVSTLEGSETLIHPPGEQACTDCHNPHESQVRHFLREQDDLHACAECHAEFLEEGQTAPYRHEYFDPQTQCGTCHYAHHGEQNVYLRENVAETCLTCHDLAIEHRGRKLENIARTIEKAKVVHDPLKKGSCPTCHTPHGSQQPALLTEGYPAGTYGEYDTNNYALCWQCHDARLAESSNGVGLTEFRDGQRNLHRTHTVEMRKGRACHLCHAAHGSDQDHLIRKSFIYGQWEAPLVWKPSETGGSCNTPCHDEKTYKR